MTLFLSNIVDALFVRVRGRLQKNRTESVNNLLIWCTIGMGEIVCMTDEIRKYHQATLVINRKPYIEDFVKAWFTNKYVFIDDIKGKFDAVIFPAWAMRRKDMKALIKLNIPLRIGQVWVKQRKYEYVFNRVLYVDNYINESKSYNLLFQFYENCRRSI